MFLKETAHGLPDDHLVTPMMIHREIGSSIACHNRQSLTHLGLVVPAIPLHHQRADWNH